MSHTSHGALCADGAADRADASDKAWISAGLGSHCGARSQKVQGLPLDIAVTIAKTRPKNLARIYHRGETSQN